MKEYTKPEIEMVKFQAEEIANIGEEYDDLDNEPV